MKIYKAKDFARFARKAGLLDAQLCDAIAKMHAGRIDADLGGSVYKQRVSRQGEGRSGGFRTVLLLRWESRRSSFCAFVRAIEPTLASQRWLSSAKLRRIYWSAVICCRPQFWTES